MREWRPGTPSCPRRAARPSRPCPIRVSRRSACFGVVRSARDNADMAYRWAGSKRRPHRHIMRAWCVAKAPVPGKTRKSERETSVAVVVAHDFVVGGQHPDRGIVRAIDEQFLERGFELGAVDRGRVIVLGIVAFRART